MLPAPTKVKVNVDKTTLSTKIKDETTLTLVTTMLHQHRRGRSTKGSNKIRGPVHKTYYKPNDKQVGSSTSAHINRANNNAARTNKSQGQRGQNNTFHQDQRRDNTNSNHPRATSTQKGKKNQRNHQNSRADPKNRRRPEPTKDGGHHAPPLFVFNLKTVLTFPKVWFGEELKQLRTTEQQSKPLVRTLFWLFSLKPKSL